MLRSWTPDHRWARGWAHAWLCIALLVLLGACAVPPSDPEADRAVSAFRERIDAHYTRLIQLDHAERRAAAGGNTKDSAAAHGERRFAANEKSYDAIAGDFRSIEFRMLAGDSVANRAIVQLLDATQAWLDGARAQHAEEDVLSAGAAQILRSQGQEHALSFLRIVRNRPRAA